MVKAFASGMLSAFGHNPTIAIRNFTGEIQFTLDKQDDASLSMKMQTGSFEATGDISRKDRQEIQQRMREEVLETANYPEIVFGSTQVLAEKIMNGEYRAQLQYNLSLNGITRSEQIDAQISLYGDTLHTHGEFTLCQTDDNIEPVTAVGGTLKL